LPSVHFESNHILILQQPCTDGVSDEDIDLEQEAVDTISNAMNSREKFQEEGLRRVIVVTSKFHLARALKIFRTIFALGGDISFVLQGEGAPDAGLISSGIYNH